MGLFEIQFEGKWNTIVSVPPGSDARGEPRPLLFFLHGSGEAAPVVLRDAMTRHGPLRSESSPTILSEFIVVAPQLPAPGGDVWKTHSAEVRNIVVSMQARFTGDIARTYLTGFSYGANGVFDIAIEQPDCWAAIWPVDPTRVPSVKPSSPVWLSLGDRSRNCYQSFLKTHKFQLAGRDTVADFVYEDRGQDHVESARLAYRDDENMIYDWMKKQKLTTT